MTIINYFKDNTELLKRLIISEEKKFIYIKMPKVAGTSIHRHTLQKEVPDIIQFEEDTIEFNKWLNSMDDNKLKEYFIFTFVRNPWDRVVSLFCYFIIKRREISLNKLKRHVLSTSFNKLIILLIRRIISHYNSLIFIKKRKITFTFFVKNMINISLPQWRIKEHSFPQHLLVKCNDIVFVDFIGRYENLENDWRIVSEKIGVSSELPHSNRTEHDEYRRYYNEETKKIIAKKYKKDIECFDYIF
jgi:hypothetical protein